MKQEKPLHMYHEHVLFEEAVYAAFPRNPVPRIEWVDRSSFARSVRELFSERTWPEVIGSRLTWGERDPPLSIWMDALPQGVVDYYLPSHLVFSSIELDHGSPSYHPMNVMRALILPSGSSEVELDEIDEELFVDAEVSYYKDLRLALYHRMSKEQRSCIAHYLSIYLEYNRGDFSDLGTELFMRNRDVWRDSLL